jgi:Fe-S-cluster containining protein
VRSSRQARQQREQAGGSGWSCINGCGACCRLDPQLRQDAIAALSAQQRSTYLSMVGEDGWCIHYDTGGRRCRVYDGRPDFCRVSNLVSLFAPGLEGGDDPEHLPAAAHTLAIRCCEQQIRSEYGGRGRVMRRFQRATRRP